MITVNEIMSVDLRTLTKNDTLADARRLMSSSHIHHIPIVTADNHLVGLVSHRDVLAATESQFSDTAIIQNSNEINIGEIMTHDVTTVDPRANLRQAAVYLQKHDYGCLPVVEDKELVGIITDSDFVGVAINLLEQMEDIEPTEA